MADLWRMALFSIFLLSACAPVTVTPPSKTPTATFPPTATLSSTPTPPVPIARYYVSPQGDDNNPGTESLPWKTIAMAATRVSAGSIVYLRGGIYGTILGGWSFQNSGTAGAPITLTNYPGEQVVINISQSNHDYMAFRCWAVSIDPLDWHTPKADYIHIAATDVTPHQLSNGVQSQKGIVIQGAKGEQAAGIEAAGCDDWEISGIDFIDVGYGVFTKKRNFGSTVDNSSDDWYIHDNRVYNYYRESGMQFNGDGNLIEKNEIYKISDELDTPYGCQLLNILGHGNIIRMNTLSRQGSKAECGGILFEWDMSDQNLIERNLIMDVPWGIEFAGGDENIVRNNLMYSPEGNSGGIEITSYDNRTSWPCNETMEAPDILPANDPADSNYQYYYNPRNCHSFGNQIYNNTVYGFTLGLGIYPAVGENTIIRNNAFADWKQAGICYLPAGQWVCQGLPSIVVADHNMTQGLFGFVDPTHLDFHLSAVSPLINAGYPLGNLNPNDYDGILRPQGEAYDIGAYEFPVP